MSDSLDFSIPKDRLVLVIICAALMLILLFGVGMATGFLLAGHPPATKDLRGEKESLGKDTSKSKPPEPGAAPAKAEGKPAAAPPATEERLSIQAASFSDEREASHLAALLKRDGYRPVSTGQDSTGAEGSYYVRLGPYRTWEQASRIASELDHSYNLHTVVRPIRVTTAHT